MSHDRHSRGHSHGHHHAGRRHSWSHEERRHSLRSPDTSPERIDYIERRLADLEYGRRRSDPYEQQRRSSDPEPIIYDRDRYRRGSLDSENDRHEGKKIYVVLPKPAPVQVVLQPTEQPCGQKITPAPSPCQKITPPPQPSPCQQITPPPPLPPCQKKLILPPCQKITPPPAQPKQEPRVLLQPKKESITEGTGQSMTTVETPDAVPTMISEDQQTSMYPIAQEYESVYFEQPPAAPVPYLRDEPGLCELCHKGYYVRKFTWSGIVAALFCFPCGIGFCFCMRIWVCNHCGESPEHPQPELYNSAATIRKQASKTASRAKKRSRNSIVPEGVSSNWEVRHYQNQNQKRGRV